MDNSSDSLSFTSTFSVSTSHTEPGLPGTGRTLGLFYDFAGQVLESQFERLARWRRRGTAAEDVDFGPLYTDGDQNWNSSASSISTTATEPNLPGAGRTVGLLIDKLGLSF